MAEGQTDHIRNHPLNEIYVDPLQGEEFLKPQTSMLMPEPLYLGYNDRNKDPKELHTASGLHCEAEGDFWVRMKDLAWAIGESRSWVNSCTMASTTAGMNSIR